MDEFRGENAYGYLLTYLCFRQVPAYVPTFPRSEY